MPFETVKTLPKAEPIPDRVNSEKRMQAVVDSLKAYISEALDGVAKIQDDMATTNQELASMISQFAEASSNMKGMMGLLKKIADKEFPTFPEFPKIPETKFPSVQKVEVSNPSKLDLTETNKLLLQVIALLGKQQPAMQPIIVQSPKDDGVVEDTAHASAVNVRTRAKSRLVPEVPTGTIDGINTKFYLSRAPRYNTQVYLFLNGQYQIPDGTTGYSISGNQITYVTPPVQGDKHYVLIFQA